MPRIEELFAFIIEEDGPGDEAVPAFQAGGVWYPLLGADRARIDSLRDRAKEIAKALKKPIRLVRFIDRIEEEVIEP